MTGKSDLTRLLKVRFVPMCGSNFNVISVRSSSSVSKDDVHLDQLQWARRVGAVTANPEMILQCDTTHSASNSGHTCRGNRGGPHRLFSA